MGKQNMIDKIRKNILSCDYENGKLYEINRLV